jgi:hypothetical protein
LVTTLIVSTWKGATGLESVEITDMTWLKKLDLPLPLTRAEVVASLGAGRVRGTTLVYAQQSEIGPTSLTLTFNGDQLVKAVWSYPFD